MKFTADSALFKGAYTISPMNGMANLPWVYSDSKTEFLACRETAWLGTNLNLTPIFDISGPDAAKFFNQTCVNKDFSVMKPGQSKHAIICNEKGKMLADGVVMKKEDGSYRTYWMAPVIQYFMHKSGLDVEGTYLDNEYFFQIDGPKSLEILETSAFISLTVLYCKTWCIWVL